MDDMRPDMVFELLQGLLRADTRALGRCRERGASVGEMHAALGLFMVHNQVNEQRAAREATFLEAVAPYVNVALLRNIDVNEIVTEVALLMPIDELDDRLMPALQRLQPGDFSPW